MRPMTGRQTLILTVFITSVTASLVALTGGGDWQTMLLTIPLVASASFWSLRLSQRIAARYAPRSVREADQRRTQPAHAVPTTDRPEHARRRREQRRPRGGRRRQE